MTIQEKIDLIRNNSEALRSANDFLRNDNLLYTDVVEMVYSIYFMEEN